MTTPSEGDALAALHAAALALVEALDRCKPTLDGYAVMAHVHGERYNGPTFGTELEELRSLLARGVRMPGSPVKCTKCGGAGWVRGRELDNPSDATFADTLTRYSCDWCMASRPSVPEGPWKAQPWISDPEGAKRRVGKNSQSAMLGWWRVFRGGMHTGAPQPSGAFETEAEALAVRDALNLVAARVPREAAP